MNFQHNHDIKWSSLFIENIYILNEKYIFRIFCDWGIFKLCVRERERYRYDHQFVYSAIEANVLYTNGIAEIHVCDNIKAPPKNTSEIH